MTVRVSAESLSKLQAKNRHLQARNRRLRKVLKELAETSSRLPCGFGKCVYVDYERVFTEASKMVRIVTPEWLTTRAVKALTTKL